MTAVDRFIAHALHLKWNDVPTHAQDAAKRFYLDTLGVGVAGVKMPLSAPMLNVAERWGACGPQTPGARVWGTDRRLPAASAAYVNAFQIHCQEFDCVHEPALVHPLATIGAALSAEAEARGGISGPDFLTALTVAVDLAASLGVAVKSPLRFFRPATAGVFGATLGIAAMRKFTMEQTRNALGYALAQAAGTMQAHVEGKPALPVQIAGAARAALVANDLAEEGLEAAHDVFEGPYGYLTLFEEDWDLEPILDALGQTWRIAEVSYKPYPTGRAAHGGLPLMRSMYERGIRPDDVENIVLIGPPLIKRLVGRPAYEGMANNYARLCYAYTGAVMLKTGDVTLSDFDAQALNAPDVLELAKRITVIDDGSPDPSAFTPQTLTVTLKSGQTHSLSLDHLYGAPSDLMTPEAAHRKLIACLNFGLGGTQERLADTLRDAVFNIETITDMRMLLSQLTGKDERHD